MRTVSIFTNGNNQAIRIPKDMEFVNLKELEIFREGDSLILRPTRPDWLSYGQLDKAGDDFLLEREDIVSDEGRFEWL